jgi:hypothetical protein
METGSPGGKMEFVMTDIPFASILMAVLCSTVLGRDVSAAP